MDHVRDWKYSAVVFFIGVLAMLVAGAWRELEKPVRTAAAVEASSRAPEQPSRAPEQPQMDEPQSNEIADFPQLD